MNLDELEIVKQRALENHIPILMDDTLEPIKEILADKKPKRILEIGTAVGYSASQFVRFSGKQIERVDTIELDELRAKEAIENIEKIGVSDKINVIIGNAVDVLPTLNDK